MRGILEKVLAAGIALTLSVGAALADQTYFVIKSADGSRPDFAVTEDVIAKVGQQSFETTLPAMDAQKHKVSGPLMRDLLAAAGMQGEVVDVLAIDKYETEIPISDFVKHGVIAAVEIDGKKITVRDKGPAWIVYPRSDVPELMDAVYEQRSVWQLDVVTVK